MSNDVTVCMEVWLNDARLSIYGELAEQYKMLDATGATNKRGVLAQHLKEVIDTLEQKVSSYTLFLS